MMTNKRPSGMVRGFGGPQIYFGRTVDASVAVELGLDPLDVIRKNLFRQVRSPISRRPAH